jgi:integrase
MLTKLALSPPDALSLVPVTDQALDYIKAARSERTRAAYREQWKDFEGWCRQHDLAALPAEPRTVVLYLSARAQKGSSARTKKEGCKVSTLSLALTAISQVHLSADYESPRSDRMVREAFKGIRRTHGSAPTQKRPLLDVQVRELAKTLPSTLGGARDRALLLVGFSGAFRRSELVALTVADLSFNEEGLTVTLRRSKTDQEAHGRKVGLPYGRAAATCPVRATKAWLKRSGISEGPLFRTVDQHGHMGGAMSGRDVANLIKRKAHVMGLNAADFSGHSLRSGLATSSAKAGKPVHAIMRQTGHRSVAMVQKYIRDAELFSDNAAAGLL